MMDCKKAQSLVTAYIKRELGEKETEEFIHHISHCRECHEELEIYFTIHFALQKLDEEENISYNIKKMLEDDLETTERKVWGRKLFRICSYGIMLVAELFLIVALITQIQLWTTGDIMETFSYRMLYGEETVQETVHVPETDRKTEKETDGEKNEQKNSTD